MALLRSGQSAFNRGEFFAAHERWEELWHQSSGAERLVVQGLIQIAAGLHHLRQGRPGPGAALLEKGVRKCAAERSSSLPLLDDLRLDALIRDVERLLIALEARPGVAPDLAGIAV